MRFMIIRKADKETEASAMASAELLEAMGQYNAALTKAGMFIAGEGLQPSSKGARVKFSGGKPSVIDGPFAEAKELIAGITIIEAKSLVEAVEWVKRWPALDGDGSVELEIRQLYDAEDFGEMFTPELREAAEQVRDHAQIQKRP